MGVYVSKKSYIITPHVVLSNCVCYSAIHHIPSMYILIEPIEYVPHPAYSV